MKTYLQKAFDEPLSLPPIWLMRQAGRYLPEYQILRKEAGSFMNLCLNPELAARVTLQPIERFDFDAAILFSDILMVPYGLGQELEFKENEGPKLGTRDNLSLAHFEKRIEPILDTAQKSRQNLETKKSLIGFAGAPFTILYYMITEAQKDVSKILMFIKEDEEFKALWQMIIEATIFYLKKQIASGVDVLQVFDSWAGLVPKEHVEDLILRPMLYIVSEIKKDFPHVPIIGFPKGLKDLETYGRFTKADGVGVCHNSTLLKDQPFLVQGNLSPDVLLQGGEALQEETQKILKTMKGQKFIFNLGHGILPQTPIDHVHDLMRLVRG